MSVAVVLLNRDLRVRDHPALVQAVTSSESVVPLFVVDDAILANGFATPNRLAFLLDCLHDMRSRLQTLGGDLVMRSGDPIRETMRIVADVGAETVFVTADVTRFARRREVRLRAACERIGVAFESTPGATVVPSGAIVPVGGDHYRVFTPYWNAWRAVPWRQPCRALRRVVLPVIDPGAIPEWRGLARGACSPDLPRGGETEARDRLRRWKRRVLAGYDAIHDDLARDATSRMSPYLHFGCVSPLELATQVRGREGGDPFLRQLCWRDFHHQVTSTFGDIASKDYRSRGDRWRRSARDLDAWKQGRTGYPIVDAGMRQLQREGWMHNRARLITASFLVKDLYLDWRLGARHFLDLLVDGDIANNSANWQWVAGTGNDTRPNRVFNPLRQAARFDPNGDYVRRYVPELSGVAGPAVHHPWDLDPKVRSTLDYPDPIVDHDDATARFRAARHLRD